MSAGALRPSELGPATGDSTLVARVEPLLRSAGLTDRVSVVHIQDHIAASAHFGARPHTVYEIGSITKTMTSLLFAEALESGELSADTTLGSLLDVNGSDAAGVTLEELASHRSGLPRVAERRRDRMEACIAVCGIATLTPLTSVGFSPRPWRQKLLKEAPFRIPTSAPLFSARRSPPTPGPGIPTYFVVSCSTASA